MQTQPRTVSGFTNRLKALYYRSAFYRLSLMTDRPARLNLPPQDMLPANGTRGAALARGEFAFQGQSFLLEAPEWAPEYSAVPWQSTLHGFSWLRDLKAYGGDASRRIARAFVSDWMAEFDQWHPVAWRADVMGTRLASWLTLHDFFLSSAEDQFRLSVYDSIARQTHHLARHIKKIKNNRDVIATLRGFLLSSIALGKDDYVGLALELYNETLPSQFLPDGGPVDRSPGTAARYLRQMVEARGALRAARYVVPDEWQSFIDRLAAFVKFFRHGDGGLALFHGTTEYEPIYLDTLLNASEAKARAFKSAEDTGYERLQAGRTSIIMDTGVAPSAPYDTETHASVLSFEMSCGKERIIVNCGSEPGAGPWHNALRATAAHSALCIADTNSVEIVRDQGIGKRGPARVPIERGVEKSGDSVTALHDGYLQNFGVVHQRTLALNGAGDELTGEDLLKRIEQSDNPSDHEFAIRFHFAPHAQIILSQDQQSALIRLGSGAGWRLRCNDARLLIEPSIYCGRSGETQRIQQIVINHILIGPDVTVNWSFKREKK